MGPSYSKGCGLHEATDLSGEVPLIQKEIMSRSSSSYRERERVRNKRSLHREKRPFRHLETKMEKYTAKGTKVQNTNHIFLRDTS